MTYTDALLQALSIASNLNSLGLGYNEDLGAEFASGLLDDLAGIINGLKSALEKVIKDALNSVGTTIRDAISGLVTSISGAFSSLGVTVAGIASAISTGVKGAIDGFTGQVSGFIAQLGNAFNATVYSLAQKLETAISGVKSFIASTVNGLKDNVERVVGGLQDVVRNVIGGTRELVSEILGSIRDRFDGAVASLREFIAGIDTQARQLVASVLQFINANIIAPIVQWVDNLRVFLTYIDKTIRDVIVDLLRQVNAFLQWTQELRPYLEAGDFIGAGGKVFRDLQGSFLGPLLTGLRAVVYIGALTAFEISLSFLPAQYAAQKSAIASAQLETVDVGTAAMAVRLGAIGTDKLHAIAAKQGISAGDADIALATTQSIIPPGAVSEASLRGIIDDSYARDRLLKSGYSGRDVDVLLALRYSIPPPTDLIRFAVREVFNEELARKLSLYEEYPEKFSLYAEQIGISDEWARRYWAAHWDLPSPTQGYEMLHRGLISEAELADLLKALDYAPVWRDKLQAISYNPLTRVDIRRMFQVGVLSEAEVFKAYKDIGYNEENAKRLTEFTKRYSAPEDTSEQDEYRRASRDLYVRAYKRGLMDRQTVSAMLQLLRYHPDDVGVMLKIADTERAESLVPFDLSDIRRDSVKIALKAHDANLISDDDLVAMLEANGASTDAVAQRLLLRDTEREYEARALIAERLHDLYVQRVYTDNDVLNLLRASEYGDAEIARLLYMWDIEREVRTRKPERSEIVSFFRKGIISANELADELRGLGYHERYVRMYLRSLGAEDEQATEETT